MQENHDECFDALIDLLETQWILSTSSEITKVAEFVIFSGTFFDRRRWSSVNAVLARFEEMARVTPEAFLTEFIDARNSATQQGYLKTTQVARTQSADQAVSRKKESTDEESSPEKLKTALAGMPIPTYPQAFESAMESDLIQGLLARKVGLPISRAHDELEAEQMLTLEAYFWACIVDPIFMIKFADYGVRERREKIANELLSRHPEYRNTLTISRLEQLTAPSRFGTVKPVMHALMELPLEENIYECERRLEITKNIAFSRLNSYHQVQKSYYLPLFGGPQATLDEYQNVLYSVPEDLSKPLLQALSHAYTKGLFGDLGAAEEASRLANEIELLLSSQPSNKSFEEEKMERLEGTIAILANSNADITNPEVLARLMRSFADLCPFHTVPRPQCRGLDHINTK